MLYLSLLYCSISFGCRYILQFLQSQRIPNSLLPLPFLCFWLLLLHHKSSFFLFHTEKEHSFLPLGRGAGFFPAPEAGNTVDTFFQSKMVLCCAKYTYPKALFADRTAIRRAKPDSRLCDCVYFVQTFRLSLDCLTTMLLLNLQCLAMTIHLTQSLYKLSMPPNWGISLRKCEGVSP